MRAKLALLSLAGFLGVSAASAQTVSEPTPKPNQPDYSTINCPGFVSDKVPEDIQLISGEQSNIKIVFSSGDYVYINRGRDKGVQVGDRFAVVRPTKDPEDVAWFKWQKKLLHAMGTNYIDAGQITVVKVQDKVSIAQVGFSCGYMLRGDIVRTFTERPAPPFKDPSTFDHFAPVSGKPVAMLVAGPEYTQLYGKGSVAYVNLGAAQGVKVGDYMRIFRYQGSRAETAPQTKDAQYKLWGFGSAPARYEWKGLPREVIGEGIVLNQSKNASTIFITYTSLDAYAGDYVEIE
ncbi:MAG: hypothetical protein NVS9B4_21200 [Candidatus Acidiferrum sp.]